MDLTYSKIQNSRDYFFNIRQRALNYPSLHKLFLKKNGYALDLKNPITHNQKINYKKLFDRDPLIPITSDKYLVREYIRKVLGDEVADEILIPIFGFSSTGQDLPFEDWDFEFFMKANHFSGGNMLVSPGMDPQFLRMICKKWLTTSYGQALHEWGYRDIHRRIICEKVLRDETGEIPNDYKFYCFQGKVEMIVILKDRFTNKQLVYIDTERNPILGAQMSNIETLNPVPEIPNYERMVALAEKLAQPFAHVRIDFYSFGKEICFGEITHYSSSGLNKFDDYQVDLELGMKWGKIKA
jgi:hypothetical protein